MVTLERERLCRGQSHLHTKFPSLPRHHFTRVEINKEALPPLPYILRRQVFRLTGQKAKPWNLSSSHMTGTPIRFNKRLYKQKQVGGTGLSNLKRKIKMTFRSGRTQSCGLQLGQTARGHAEYHRECDVPAPVINQLQC